MSHRVYLRRPNGFERLELFDVLVVGDEVELQAGRAGIDDEN
jgi:hypothetical protein